RWFAEIQPRRLIDAKDGTAPRVAEVDLVDVELEDFVFVEARIEDHREQQLDKLSAPRAFLGQDPRLDDLLVDRAAALDDPAPLHVREKCPRHSDRIDAQMMMKTDVFR